MSVTKKTRFEVFKRDGFQCAYCGNTPPKIVLEIDHIEPVSKGGSDDINNLITSCFDCNRGKTNIPLNKIPNKLSENLEILEERENQLKEYRKFINKIERRVNKEINEVQKVFQDSFPDREFAKNFRVSVKQFLTKLSIIEVKDFMNIACSKGFNAHDTIKYFCGICWRNIRGDNE